MQAFEAELKAGGVHYELHWYEADHAFANENNAIYNPEATQLAWERSLAFLATHLS